MLLILSPLFCSTVIALERLYSTSVGSLVRPALFLSVPCVGYALLSVLWAEYALLSQLWIDYALLSKPWVSYALLSQLWVGAVGKLYSSVATVG